MVASLKRRLDTLATAIEPLSPYHGLLPDESDVLCIALMQSFLPAWCEWVERETEARKRAGEPLVENPEIKARCERVFERIVSANNRVGELQAQGRLEPIVERLKQMGRWPDDQAD